MPKTANIQRLFILAKKHRESTASLGRVDETASGIACREACEKFIETVDFSKFGGKP